MCGCGRAAVVVGGDARPPVELDSGRLETETLDERCPSDRDEHQVALDRLALAEVHRQRVPVLLHAGALLPELQRDAALRERLGQLLGSIGILLRDQRVEHLDDRHLGAEAVEDRCELGADDAAAEHDEAPRNLGLRQEAGRVDAQIRLETLDRRAQRERSRRDDRRLEGTPRRRLRPRSCSGR